MPGIGAVGNQKNVVKGANARIFNAKFFVSGKAACRRRGQKRLGAYTEAKAVRAFRQSDERPPVAQVRPKEHDVPVSVLGHPGIMDRFHRVGHVLFRKNRIAAVAFDHRFM
jgi:hypothetical protein